MLSRIIFITVYGLIIALSSSAPAPIYPEPHFARLLNSNSVFSSGYCLENGLSGTVQVATDQAYQALQHCYVGPVTVASDTSLVFGHIGSVSESYADLGPLSGLGRRVTKDVNDGTAYSSITVCPDDINHLCCWDSFDSNNHVVLKPLNATLYQSLLTVGNADLTPVVGHVYLIRLTNTNVGTTQTVTDQTTMLLKFILIEKIGSTFSVEWSVFFGDQKYVKMDVLQTADIHDNRILTAMIVTGVTGGLAFAVSILSLIIVSVVSIILLVTRRKMGYSTVN